MKHILLSTALFALLAGPASAGCVVGIGSAACMGAVQSPSAYRHVRIENVTATSAVTVACAWGATAVLNSTGSIQLAQGQSFSWDVSTGGVPQGTPLNCIASAASTPLYTEAN